MPTFSAIALDRLIEPGPSKYMTPAKNIPASKLERGMNTSNSKLERRNSTSATTVMDKKHHWILISPALYATPESTPLPDSPSSFPPSPYIVNHKRRGPRLLKSFSEDDVAAHKRAINGEKVDENAVDEANIVANLPKDATFTATVGSPVEEEHINGFCHGELGTSDSENNLATQKGLMKSGAFNMGEGVELEDCLDPQDFTSARSYTEGESNSGVEQSATLATPGAEFFDAWEELSSEGGPLPPSRDVEAELREMRLTVLMEIEKRKHAEEALVNMRTEWLRIRQQLSLVGLTLPADPISTEEEEQLGVDHAEELCRQVYLARFVSNSIGRGTAKAEVDVEMEAQMESKNFEIARLCDRLHYYEVMNREMSQRNQEAIEMARCETERRQKRQRWVWGSIAAAITLGTGALAWSYLSTGNGPSSSNKSFAAAPDSSAE